MSSPHLLSSRFTGPPCPTSCTLLRALQSCPRSSEAWSPQSILNPSSCPSPLPSKSDQTVEHGPRSGVSCRVLCDWMSLALWSLLTRAECGHRFLPSMPAVTSSRCVFLVRCLSLPLSCPFSLSFPPFCLKDRGCKGKGIPVGTPYFPKVKD